MKLSISEPFQRGDGAILVHDEHSNDIAEFFHNERHTVPQSYETALALAKRLVATPVQGVAAGDPIYQAMSTDDDEAHGSNLWMDVSKEAFDQMSKRSDMRVRVVYSAASPALASRSFDGAAHCGEFMPLSLKPLDDPNYDPGEHQVLDADTAYVFKIGATRDRAERIVAALNAGAQIETAFATYRKVTSNIASVREKQLAAERLKPWRTELDELVGHLGAAVTQSTDKDDRIIMGHVMVAHEIAKIVRRKA